MLNINYSETGDIALKNQNTLRRIVGALGMFLPLALYLFIEIDSNYSTVLPSISHYYYTRAAGIFVIIVSMLSVFLLIYKGEDTADFYTSTIAGISSLLLLLFPTDNLSQNFDPVCVTVLKTSDFRMYFHFICAGIFLLSLAYMSAFLFTKSNLPAQSRGKKKIIRNRIYRICAFLIVAAIAAIIIFRQFFPLVYEKYPITFWMEVVAVEAFGFSWLVKGKSILDDN
ncbi:hypothetical protein ACFSJW_08930 [Flavobacterium artemisiae]|uniref:DUF998 domain-containing protein n=1 Tax=Flavobacterium artemisiae TaxID=2126556 RepID=A0ABW4HFU6_9FLAO